MRLLLALLIAGCVALGCSKHSSSDLVNRNAKVMLIITYQVDGQPLAFDSLQYTNDAGNHYSVTRLQYYLSDIRLYRNGQVAYNASDVIFVDGRNDPSSKYTVTPPNGLKTGRYDSIVFLIGVDIAHNLSNVLPASTENIAMGWPDEMGGGYHFFKLEGHWLDNGNVSGFALHIGQNGYQVPVKIPLNVLVQSSGDLNINLTMNLNEWFRNPAVYDLLTDGVFTMGDTVLMRKLCRNGTDVFENK